MRLGNGKFESTVFNSRLQPTQIALGTSASSTSLLKLNYDYGTTDNNGNVKSQTITVAGMSHPLIQTYTYDSLNRLQSAEEKSNNIPQWKQTFTFDRYGNRRFDTSNNNTTTLPENFDTNVFNPTFNTANNRMNDNQGYEYDSAGNVTKDAANKRFIYDAENKQTSFGTNGSTTNGGTYFYDGDGKRIKKIVGTETTVFVYNASGQMVAEYSTTTPTAPQISYLTSDTLGTTRINTDANGQVTARHDYMPFGEEIIGLGNRQSTNGYQTDNIRQKFTGYERDNETDLDFAQARMYGYSLGRFTSPDPLSASANPIRPQSWNRYIYSFNNPLRFTDPSGMVAGDYYDLKGNFLGTDGKEDDMTYIVYDNQKSRKLEDRKKIEIPDASKVIPAIIKSYDDSEKPTSEYPAGAKKGGFHEEAVVVDVVDGKSEISTSTGPYSPDPTNGAHVTLTITENTKLISHTHPSGEKTTVDDPSTKSGSGTTVRGPVTTSTARFLQKPSQTDIDNALPNGTNIVVAARDKQIYFYAPSGNNSKCNCIAQMSLDNFKKVGQKK